MIPILFNQSQKKIGWLSDCISCEVTEERNGVYELSLVYPISGRNSADIAVDGYIKAKPNQTSVNQFFKIYKVSKPINGKFTVSAEHISYALSGYPVQSVSASGSAQVAINAILTAAKNQLGKDTGFKAATTDITLSSSINLANVSARAALGGVRGSVLDTYGGEYEFDNYTIKLHKSRGADNGVRISYGKNMTDLKCDIDMSASYTGIYGYVKTDNVDLVCVKTVTNSSGISTRFLIKDFSSELNEEEITQTDLNNAVNAYLSSNDINSINVSMSVSFVDLSQSEEYKAVAPLEAVNLCDTVKIYYKDLGVNAKAKVIKTVYNSLKECYNKIELGSARANMSSVIAQATKAAEEAKNAAAGIESKITQDYLKAIDDATNAITGNSGGYIRLNPAENPQELLIMNTANISTAKNIWRFNLSGFGHSSTGYNGKYTTAVTQDGHIVADFIDTGTLTANIIKAGILSSPTGQFSFNLDTGHIEASDINITGGDINLDGGTLSIVNNDGYKADLSGGVLDLYHGAGTGSGTGYKYLSFASSILFKTALGTGDYYANLVLPSFTDGENASKGLRIGTSGNNASAVTPAIGGLDYNWDTDFAIFEKEKMRVRQCIEVNENKIDQFEALIHHRKVGGANFKLGVGIAKMNAEKTPGAGFEIRGEQSNKLWAGLYAWTEKDNVMRLTFQTSNEDGTTYSKTLTANGDEIFFAGRRLKFADEK